MCIWLLGQWLEILNLIKCSQWESLASYGIQRYVLLHATTYFKNLHISKAYIEPIQTSDMDLYKIIARGFKPSFIFGKSATLDIWLSPERTSASRERQEKKLFFKI